MSLPKLNTPEYKLNIPSTDEEITYRPFLVKEEKLLLIAQETGTENATYNAIKTIIKNCCSGNIDIEKMPLFDMEYFFLNIVQDPIQNSFPCQDVMPHTCCQI